VRSSFQTLDALLRHAMEQWRKRLIDLTPRNPLLHSGTRRRRLALLEPSPEEAWTLLLQEDETLLLVPEDWKGEGGPLSEQEEQDLDREEWLASLLQQSRWSRYPKARIAYPGKDLLSALVRLRRRVRTFYYDAGFWTLFLAFGLLRWSPAQRTALRSGPETWESPLLLVPVTLEQESPGNPFLLSLREEEEVQFNLALKVYLQDVEQISLPEVDPENLSETLEVVANAVRERGWTVQSVCWLNLFSFHKMAIYRDLKDNEDRIIQHPVVQALAGVSRPDLRSPTVIDKSALDTRPSSETATVLPADSSQLEAVLRARKGETFWIHGPPGTGKSQTIVNIIADALTQEKSVLFVSEKRAALEVVLRRLRQVGLVPFCLDLHDYRIKRGQVVKSIAEEMRRGWKDRSAPPARLPADLDLRRKVLADYTKAVHTPRRPLNRTPYQVIGRVSCLPVVQVPAEIPMDVANLTEEKLAEIIHLAQALSPVVDLAREGPAFPWWGIQVDAFSEKIRTELLGLLQGVKEALGLVTGGLRQVCRSLGLRSPDTVEQAWEFQKLLEAFQGLPPLPRAWTQKRDVQLWLTQGRETLSALKQFMEARERVSPFVETALLSPKEEASLFAQDVRAIQETVAVLFSSSLLKEALSQPVALLLNHRPLLQDLRTALERAGRQANTLRAGLGLDPCMDLRDVERTVALAKALVRGLPLELQWLQRRVPAEALDKAQHFLSLLSEWKGLRQDLLREWKEDLLNLKAQEAWNTWQRWQGSPLRFLVPSYRSLTKRLRETSCSGKPSRDRVFQVLQTLQRLQALQTSLQALQREPGLSKFLGRYYAGLQTDLEKAGEALSLAQAIRNAFPTGLPLKVRRLLSGRAEADDEQMATAESLLETWLEWTESTQALGLTEEALSATGEPLKGLLQGLREAEKALERLAHFWKRLTPLLKEQISVADLPLFLEDLYQCLEARERFRELAKALATEWEWIPEATPEAWEEALSNLEVWAKLLSWVKEDTGVPDPLTKAGRDPRERPLPEPLVQSLRKWEGAFQAFAGRFSKPFPRVQGKVSFGATEFPDLIRHLQRMRERVEEVQRYVDLQRFREALAEHLSAPVVDALLQNPDLPREDLPKAVERLVLARWLDCVFAEDPVLKDFRWEQHQQYLKEFQRLDKKLEEWASSRAIRILSEQRSNIIESRPEVQMIRREARKQRRHRPIRRVLREAFHTILSVKPCWLMSPLSVSYFLLPDHQFDLVIFDEASQVRPEDAIPAIYRAKQVVICGDPKQLPPTAFFEARVLDAVAEEEQEEEEEATYIPEGQSVLETLEGVLPSVFLRWHYRSKDERLIAFSNYRIYEGELITFPTPGIPGRDTGVEYKYLPNAVYERSGRRVNQAEVEEVCRQVFKHLERWGTSRTLGVVTMNEAQKDAVLDELERRSRQDLRLRLLWKEEKWPHGEPFFVKNLEAVQGDERDVIIISTTYGRGPDGRLTLHFGPLTQAGGERRLNVLVTRAREKVVLVTSLQPEDLRLSNSSDQEGLRVFQAYLRYARDGTLSTGAVSEGETNRPYESEFEASVADVLRSWGYEVVPQYGVGPYRIDLAVRDPLDPERVQIAVECDGATYHSLPTVRERDRIRQEWLERQGWKVVRVWSTDWWYQRRRAEERVRQEVEKALRKARAEKGSNPHSRPPSAVDGAVVLHSTLIEPAPDLRTRLLREKKVEIYHPPIRRRRRRRGWKARYTGKPRIADPKDPSTIRRLDEIELKEMEDLLRVSAEALAPCKVEDLLREVALLLGFRRLGKRIRARLHRALRSLLARGAFKVEPQGILHLDKG